MPKVRIALPPFSVHHNNVSGAALQLRASVSDVLGAWSSEEIEEAAWVFALEGWQTPLELGLDYDRAFTAYLLYLERAGVAGVAGSGTSAFLALESLRHLLEELRNRVQFIHTRAADIRISSQFDKFLATTFERVLPLTDRLLKDVKEASEEGRNMVVTKFGEDHGPLLRALADAVGRRSGVAGAAIHAAEPWVAQVHEVFKALTALGVTGNLVTDALKTIVVTAAPHLLSH